ncbi:MAG: hypothetical protein V9E96_17320, partial [Chitinophagaceae bacterium]
MLYWQENATPTTNSQVVEGVTNSSSDVHTLLFTITNLSTKYNVFIQTCSYWRYQSIPVPVSLKHKNFGNGEKILPL